MSINDIVSMSPKELADYCDEHYFSFPVLPSVETPDDLRQASEQMGILTGYYSFTSSMLSHLKYMVRDAKKSKQKELADDLIDKKVILENAQSVLQQLYASLSRRISVHHDIMTELKMTDQIYKRRD